MAAAKRRFPYNAREDAGRVYAEAANGKEYLFTGTAGEAAKRAAKAQAAVYAPVEPPPGQDPDFDAHQFNIAAEAAYALPRAARGGVRDLAPDDAAAAGPGASPAALDALHTTPTPSRIPTLAEVEESRRYLQGEAPVPAGDTIYVDPEEEERRRRARPAASQARPRTGAEVHFNDPEKPVWL